MICSSCREGADNTQASLKWRKKKHAECVGETRCSCQHRVRSETQPVREEETSVQ